MAAPRMPGFRLALRAVGRHRRVKAPHLALAAAALVAGAGSLGHVGLSGSVAVASRPSTTTTTFHVNHFNVGAPHSPQLLSQLAGSTTSGTMTPATSISTAVQGVDVASYQESGGIDWSAVASAGKQFVAIKATEGDYYQNPYALTDLSRAKAAGLAVAAYAFAIPNGGGSSASPVTQADDIINYLKSGPAGVPPIMLDIEYDPYSDGTNTCYGLSPSAMLAWIESFSAEIYSKTGQHAIIYTAQQWWSHCVASVSSTDNPFASNPLWVAAYTATTSPGTLPSPWSSGAWTYWQYGQGTVSGIKDATCPNTNDCTDLDQLSPNLLTLLNPGDQQDQANGGPITAVDLHTSQSVTYSASGLPSGLTLDSTTGQITGDAPTTTGTSTVTVTATTASGSQSASFTWYWNGALSITSPVTSLSTIAGTPTDRQIQVTDTPAESPVMFSAPTLSSTHRLPPGLSISPSGKVTGWADKPGTYKVSVYAADVLEASDALKTATPSYSPFTFTWTVSVAPDSGPTGHLHLDLGGRCLEDPKASASVGTVADIRACYRDPAQRWTYAQDDSLRIQGLCLQSPATEGSKVTLQTCTGQANQQWQLAYPRSVRSSAPGTAALALYNQGSGMCLNDPGSSTANGTQLTVWPCSGYRAQEWTLPRGPVQSGIAGKCLDDYKNLTINGNKVDEYACNGARAQAWTAHADGTVRIDGKCLNVRGGGTASGTLVSLYSCNGSSAQLWRLIGNGGVVMLWNPHSSKCVADPADSTVNGTQLQIRPCTAGDAGRNWRVS